MAMMIKENTWWDIFWSMMWGVWLRRNAWVFELKKVTIEDVVGKASRLAYEYQASMGDKQPAIQKEIEKRKIWVKPRIGFVKINSDATIFKEGKVGFGGIMRDDVGDIMMATCMSMEGCHSVGEAKALAVRHSLSVALEAGLRSIELDSDCLKFTTHLQQGRLENTSFGNLVFDILELGSQYIYSHVYRSGNQVAHNLAQLSRKYEEFRVWIEEGSPKIMGFVRHDLELVE